MRLEIKLPRPHEAQRAVLQSSARFRVMMCGRRFGKSLISQRESIIEAIKGKRVAYITPTYQLGKVFFKEMIDRLPGGAYKKNEQDMLIEFPGGGSVRFFTGERLDALRGMKFHLVIIDEASYIANLEEGWNNSIRPTLTDYMGRAIFLSTPRGKNFFYSLFLKNEGEWHSFKFSTYDNPFISRSEIDDAKSQLPASVFEQEYMANPMENAANPFGSDKIQLCTKPLSTLEPLYFGIDLAKSVDWTVITGLDTNGDVAYFERFQKDWFTTKSRIKSLPKNAAITIDSTGVGDSVVEDLQKHFTNMHGFKFTSQSKQQLMERLVSSVHSGSVGFPEGPIRDEMGIIEYQYTATGVRYGAPSGFHDDCVVSLALADHSRQKLEVGGYYSFA